MVRKSRKHPNIDLIVKPSRCTVGYIRDKIYELAQNNKMALTNAMERYEKFVLGKSVRKYPCGVR